jgi:two-component system, OmpR family, sensor histidine kinase BaeS
VTDRWLSPLGVRLAASFVAVAVTAVTVLTLLTLASARGEVSALIHEVHRGDAAAAAAAAAAAYEAGGGWAGADLAAVTTVAARGQATVTVLDTDDREVAAPIEAATRMMASMHGVELVDTPRGEPVSAPVTVDGEQVGTVALRFPSSHLPSPQLQLRDALSRPALLGAGAAVAVAVLVAVVVARQVSRPIAALTHAAIRVEAGERDVRVGRADAPGEIGTLSHAFDRMAAAIQHQDELRRRLVHDVAHELRTPLSILQATTEGMVDGVLPTDQATVESLHEEVVRLGTLVGDLEVLAAADAAGLSMTHDPVDLAELATAIADLSGAAASDAGLDLHLEVGAAAVTGDQRRLIQVVTNLVSNALRYTPAGGTVLIRTGTDGPQQPDHGPQAWLEVLDTGPGLSDEDQAHAFDRFYRGTAGEGTAGSGIGLAVAAELVHAHDGEITAQNRPSGGAHVRITLPARD